MTRFTPLRLGATMAMATMAALGAGACSSSSSGSGAPTPDGPDATVDAADPRGSDGASDGATRDDAATDGVTVLTSGHTDLVSIAATETTVYFAERGGSAVRAVALEGGTVADLALGGTPSGVAVVGSDLFWSDFQQGTLSRRPLAGGSVTTVMATPGKPPVALAGAADRIVVVALGANLVGQIQQYLPDFSAGPVVGGQMNPWGVAVSGTGAIFWPSSTGSIVKGQTGSTAASEVATLETDCKSVAADGAGVYWARPSEGLVRALLDGQTVITLATAQKTPSALVADASGVYWLTADGKLRRSSRNELPVTTIAQGFSGPSEDPRGNAIALTGKYVVWITSDGQILRHDK